MQQRPGAAEHSTPSGESVRAGSSALVVAGVVAVGLIALFAGEFALSVPTLCAHMLLWDTPCGGCGMTRAFVAAASADWVGATMFNPLWPGVMAAMAWVVGAVAGGKSRIWPPRWSLWLLLGAVLGLHVLRQFGHALPPTG